MNGKPRDPPGIMPPRENNREPGVKPQLPEGWNKPLNRDEWRNGEAPPSTTINGGVIDTLADLLFSECDAVREKQSACQKNKFG